MSLTLTGFPADVLCTIAGMMTLEEWARASGACRLFHHLQLDSIQLKLTSVPGAAATAAC